MLYRQAQRRQMVQLISDKIVAHFFSAVKATPEKVQHACSFPSDAALHS